MADVFCKLYYRFIKADGPASSTRGQNAQSRQSSPWTELLCLDRTIGMRLKFGRLTPTRDLSGGEPRGSAGEKSLGNSKSTLRRDLLFLDATDRVPARAAVAAEHADIAAVDAEAAGVGTVRAR